MFALTKVASGSITFDGRDITGLKTAALVPLGISAVPQSRNVFPTLTVDENLDECTLCDLCMIEAPDRVKVVKLYRE